MLNVNPIEWCRSNSYYKDNLDHWYQFEIFETTFLLEVCKNETDKYKNWRITLKNVDNDYDLLWSDEAPTLKEALQDAENYYQKEFSNFK